MKKEKQTQTTSKKKVTKKLIVTDLDGTLLNSNEEVSEYSINVIRQIIKKGHIFCIATGRPLRSSIHIYNKLGLNTIIANLNGSILTNPSDNNFLPINLTFSREIIKEIFKDKELRKTLGCVLIENIDGTYVLSDDEKNDTVHDEFLKKFHIGSDKEVVKTNFDNLDVIRKDINSILIWFKDKHNIDYYSFKIKGLTETLIVRSWSIKDYGDGVVLEINSIFSNKGTILKFLSSYYAIPLRDCISFGDGENDIEMLTKIGNGYAMKNGSETVKLLTQKITQYDNNHDGVAKELAQIFKIK